MKTKIRKLILQKRKNLPDKEWEKRSLIIQKKFLNAQYYKDAKSIFTYFHFDREVKTDLIIENALRDNKAVCVPKNNWENCTITPSRIMSLEEVKASPKSGKPVPEPAIVRPYSESKIELVIVPGVVFDIYGNRIGMGKGFFDRFLSKLPKTSLKVALAFEFQIMKDRLPVDSWDIMVDILITEERCEIIP